MTIIGVDTGGTFTDVFTSDGRAVKVPSTPENPAEAILAGLEAAGAGPGDAVGHGTTVATNAVLERKGARAALITTAGFEDVLAIRRQNRPSLYDLFARWPEALVPSERRFGARERMDFEGHALQALTLDDAEGLVEQVLGQGPQSIAICLLFAYVNPEHERALGELVRHKRGESYPLSLSHRLAPQQGEYERTSTTVVNAYVMPIMRRYLDTLAEGLEHLGVRRLHVMHSNGGLLPLRAAAERPVQTVLSGPAAGVVGARALAQRSGPSHIITFDMGGTSTDVAVVPGEILESGEGEIASFPLLIPMLTIETVGAGGGSIARVDAAGGLHVGPESAGAVPGPAAYGSGDQPTVSDANLVLGRLSPRGLLGGRMPLDRDRAWIALSGIARQLDTSVEAAAWAVVQLANSNMERAIRTVTLQRGHDPRRFVLFPFGGAGPLHAAEMAVDLGIERILVPPHPGVMAALGLTIPDLQRDAHRTVLVALSEAVPERLDAAFAELEAALLEETAGEELFGAPVLQRALDMRYVGQSFELRVPYGVGREPAPGDYAQQLGEAFTREHERRYGYAPPGERIEVVNVRIRISMPRLSPPELVPPWPEAPRAEESREVWFGSTVGIDDLAPASGRILWRSSLPPGTGVQGPAVIEQYDSATLVPPGWSAVVDSGFNLLLSRGAA